MYIVQCTLYNGQCIHCETVHCIMLKYQRIYISDRRDSTRHRLTKIWLTQPLHALSAVYCTTCPTSNTIPVQGPAHWSGSCCGCWSRWTQSAPCWGSSPCRWCTYKPSNTTTRQNIYSAHDYVIEFAEANCLTTWCLFIFVIKSTFSLPNLK